MVESGGLENRWGFTPSAGSNPVLSATSDKGEMSELAEGARLEIVCAAKSGTEGSNPSLSAKLINA